ncbi:MAG: pilus assembly protein PilP [Pseudomonadota bacterium]
MSVANHTVLRIAAIAFAVASLAGCSKDMSDLERYADKIKARPGGRIEPLPPVKEYKTYRYVAVGRKSPFAPTQPDAQDSGQTAGSDLIDRNRNREILEQYPLDTMRMVGSLRLAGRDYALVQSSDGIIHRVVAGNYMGQNHGRVVSISDAEISLVEVVPNGMGGYMERQAAVALSE